MMPAPALLETAVAISPWGSYGDEDAPSLRWTRTAIERPGPIASTICSNCRQRSPLGLLSIIRITSPTRMPTRSAGPLSTLATITPPLPAPRWSRSSSLKSSPPDRGDWPPPALGTTLASDLVVLGELADGEVECLGVWPRRRTSTLADCPTRVTPTSCGRVLESPTSVPLYFTTTSPGSKPAFSAGLREDLGDQGTRPAASCRRSRPGRGSRPGSGPPASPGSPAPWP